MHQLSTSTSLGISCVSVFLKQHSVLWCLSSCPGRMCILHMLQQGRVSLPSCISATFDLKCLYIRCSIIRLVLCSIAGHPCTGHSNNFKIMGGYTTYVVVPPPPTSNPHLISPCSSLVMMPPLPPYTMNNLPLSVSSPKMFPLPPFLCACMPHCLYIHIRNPVCK